MCIINDAKMLQRERSKTGRLMLWKVIAKDNTQGVWNFTYSSDKFDIGRHIARAYSWEERLAGRFHCLVTREAARQYRIFVADFLFAVEKLKIIKVYANRKDIVSAGVDEGNNIPTITVSKMTIKSLKHQR